MFCKKGFLKNFTKFTGKHLCQSLFFNAVAGLDISKNTFSYRTTPVAASAWRPTFITSDAWGDEYQKVLILIAQVLSCRNLFFYVMYYLCQILFLLFIVCITWSDIFVFVFKIVIRKRRVLMWQLDIQLFASSYTWLAYIFEEGYSTVVTSVSKKSGLNQSELEK